MTRPNFNQQSGGRAQAQSPKRGASSLTVLLLSLLIISTGTWVARDSGKRVDLRMRRELARQARDIAATILPDDVHALSFRADDAGRPEFRRLSDQLRAYAEATGLRRLYTLALRDGNLVFGPEVLDPDNPGASPPGTVYEESTEKDFEIFRAGETKVRGPMSDRQSSFVTATVPIIDPQSGEVLMAVRIDKKTTIWRTQILKAQWISFLTALIPLGILLVGFFVVKIRVHLGPAVHKRLRHTETVTCAIIMLVLTFMAAFLAYTTEKRSRDDTFLALAQTKAEVYTDALRDMRFSLNMMVNFFESSEFITREEFSFFCRPLLRSNPIQACLWLPKVTAAEAQAFAARIRMKDRPDFTLRQLNGTAMPVPAEESVLYPALYIEPLAGHEAYLGYDAASNPVWRAAIDEAIRTDKPAATEPLLLTAPSEGPSGFFVSQPAFTKQQQGVVGIAVQLESLLSYEAQHLHNASPNLSAHFFQLRAGESPRLLAASRDSGNRDCWPILQAGLHRTVPVFLFGKTYSLLISPDPQWIAAHPLRDAQVALVVGIVLTLLITLLIEILSNRPALLEKLVQKRSGELKKSEVHLRITLNSIGDGVISTDMDGRITDMNSVAEKLTGWTQKESAGQPLETVFRILSATTRNPIKNPVAAVLKTGKITGLANHTLLISKDGHEIPIADSAAPIRNDAGEITGVVLVFRDQTEEYRKRCTTETRLKLLEYAAEHPLSDLLTEALDEIGRLVNSPIGFYHFVEADQKTLSLQQWSTRTLKEFCHAEGHGLHYDIAQAGVWTDCVQTKAPVIHNDYASLPHKKGLPEGHAAVIRELVVPVMRNGKIVAILGVGNKPNNYTAADVETVSGLADLTWDIVQQKLDAKAMHTKNKELERFNKASVGRELRMIELKQEINTLCRELGKPEPYAPNPTENNTETSA